jgi:phage anti-repressor protein
MFSRIGTLLRLARVVDFRRFEVDLTIDLAMGLMLSEDEFPIDFDQAWRWIGYSKKSNAKRGLETAGFEKDFDYKVLLNHEQSDNHAGLTPQERAVNARTEEIWLTVDCFKLLAMMAQTSRGQEVRQYFLACEKRLKEMALRQAEAKRLSVIGFFEFVHNARKRGKALLDSLLNTLLC